MLTKWEIGQELIAISDCMAEKIYEFEDGELIEKLQKMRAEIGEEFNKLKSHDFGIYDISCFDKQYGDKNKP